MSRVSIAFRSFTGLPHIFWLLVSYIVLTNTANIFVLYKTLILADFQYRTPQDIGILLMVYALGNSFCNLLLGGLLDHSRNIFQWFAGSRMLAGALLLTLFWPQPLALLCMTVGILSVVWFIAVLATFKIIRDIASTPEQRNAMRVLFSTMRHIGWLGCAAFGYLCLSKLGSTILQLGGGVIIIATLFVCWRIDGSQFCTPIKGEVAKHWPLTRLLHLFSHSADFFLASFLCGSLYGQATLNTVVPLLLKKQQMPDYINKFGVMEIAANALMFLMPALFAFLEKRSFRVKLQIFLIVTAAASSLAVVFEYGSHWLWAVVIYALTALATESALMHLLNEASERFPMEETVRLTGYFEFSIAMGMAAAGLMTPLLVDKPWILYSGYLGLPLVIYLLAILWQKRLAKKEARCTKNCLP